MCEQRWLLKLLDDGLGVGKVTSRVLVEVCILALVES
jgi:hypothetical protein